MNERPPRTTAQSTPDDQDQPTHAGAASPIPTKPTLRTPRM